MTTESRKGGKSPQERIKPDMKLKKFFILLAFIAILASTNAFAAGHQLEVRHYVDEFGDSTGNGYITQGISQSGTFSNSATTNSRISWRVLVDDSDVAFIIDEYGSYRVKGSTGFPDNYTVSVKTPVGEVYRLTGHNYSDRITLSSYDAKQFRG